MTTKATFSPDDFIWKSSSWVRIGLAFPQGRFYLELMHKNCEGFNCPRGVQEDNRRAGEVRQSLFFELRTAVLVHFISGSIWNLSNRIHEQRSNCGLIRKQTQLEPISSSMWNRSKQSRGSLRPSRIQNATVLIRTDLAEMQQPKG